jgi:hypothetical protein
VGGWWCATHLFSSSTLADLVESPAFFMRRPPRTGITFSFVVSQSASAVAMAVNLRRVSPVCVFFLIGTGTGTTAFLIDKGVDKLRPAQSFAPLLL